MATGFAAATKLAATAAPAVAGLAAADYSAILASPSRRRGAHFSLHWRVSSEPRLGLVVSRKLSGSAVKRNLVKRHARALFRDSVAAARAASRPGFDVVLRLTAGVKALERDAQYAEMRALFGVLAKAGAAR